MAEQPIAWLWQNARVLEDGCFNFYVSQARAEAEVRFCGGWVTPVVDQGPTSLASASMQAVWRHLEHHRPQQILRLGPRFAAAVRSYLISDEYLACEARQLPLRDMKETRP